MSTATIPQFSPERFRDAIAKSGVSKRVLVRHMGVPSTSIVYQYLNGKKTPKLETVYKLASALSCKFEDLCMVGGDDE